MAGPAAAEPGHGLPLTHTTGAVYRVGTAEALLAAVEAINNAGVPSTVLLSNGVYVLDTWAIPMTTDDVLVRSLSGERDGVVLRGPDEGHEAGLEHVFWVAADRVTIADLTLGWCAYHGIQALGHPPYDVAGLWVHNCRFVNCGEQFIKGTSAPGDSEGVTDSLVECSLFEFTNRWAYQYYTGGLDVHQGVNWIVRDNLFRYLRAQDGMAEHAIHFWKRSTGRPQNVLVERNVILYCDRGIGFGLSSHADGFEGGASVIRNNLVFNDDATAPHSDVGIGLESASGVSVDHNTVWVPPYWAPIEYRFAGSTNLMFRNNLANRAITARDGAPSAPMAGNLIDSGFAAFRDLAAGDLRLRCDATQAIGRAVAIAGLADDLEGEPRPAGAACDIGADEYHAATADSDGDGLPDAWEQEATLDPLDPADAALDADGDTQSAWAEWVAGTDPTNDASFFQWLEITGAPFSNHWKTLTWSALSGRVYRIHSGDDLLDGLHALRWSGTSAVSAIWSWTETNAAESPARFYRLSASLP